MYFGQVEVQKKEKKNPLCKECSEMGGYSKRNSCSLPSLHLRVPQCQAEPGCGLASWDEAHTTSRFPWCEIALWIQQRSLQGVGERSSGEDVIEQGIWKLETFLAIELRFKESKMRRWKKV